MKRRRDTAGEMPDDACDERRKDHFVVDPAEIEHLDAEQRTIVKDRYGALLALEDLSTNINVTELAPTMPVAIATDSGQPTSCNPPIP